MKEKTCAIIASPPLKYPWGYNEEDANCCWLKSMIRQEIATYIQRGIKRFAVAVDSGYGLYSAEIIKEMRESKHYPAIQSELNLEANPEMDDIQEADEAELDYSEIELYCYLPYEDQATKWTPNLRERYFEALANCTETVYINPYYTESCYQKAKLAAIDSAAHTLVIRNKIPNDQSLDFLVKYMEQMGMNVNQLYSRNDIYS